MATGKPDSNGKFPPFQRRSSRGFPAMKYRYIVCPFIQPISPWGGRALSPASSGTGTGQGLRGTFWPTIMMKGAFGFLKRERISDPQDFRKTMKFGKRLNSENFILFLNKNQNGFPRLGIVVKKDVGPATYRNRVKRYIREFFRLHKHQIRGSLDVVLLVRKGTSINRYSEAERELKRCII